MSTGPQTIITPVAGDNPAYGERTGEWLAGVRRDHRADAQDAIAAAIPAHGHARTRTSRFGRLFGAFRVHADVPELPSRLLAAKDGSDEKRAPAPVVAAPPEVAHDVNEPTWGYVARNQLEHGTQHEPSSIAHLYATLSPEVHPAADPSWGPWDDAGNSEPLQPVPYVAPPAPPAAWQLPVPAEVSARRMAVLRYPDPATATRDQYAAVLRQVDIYTGTRTAEEQPAAWSWLPAGRDYELPITWGWQREPMLALPPATDEYRARMAEESIEAYDALYPVPEAMEARR